MKLHLRLIIVLFVLSTAVMAGKVEMTYHFDSPKVSKAGNFQAFNFNNTMLSALPGQPVMPYRQVSLMLPPGEAATGIEIIFSGEISYPGKYEIYPQQNVSPLSVAASGVFMKDNAVYSQNAFVPADPKGKLITSFLNGRSFALTSFTPARYNPVTGQLVYYTSARVIITTAADAKATEALENLIPSSPEADHLAENKEMENAYARDRQVNSGDYEYLIITGSAFSTSFNGMITNYLREGIRTSVVTVESIISSMSGIDTPEKIRKYIIQEYQAHGVQYVLLGGDVELVPARGFYCYVQSGGGYTDNSIPADLYYSALDGNWNTNGDAKWGEPGEDDLLPDIAVARMPFSNAAELTRMLNKSYKYQFEPVAGEFRKVLMAGEWLYDNPLTYGSDYLELLKGERSDNGYTTNGIPTDYNFEYLYENNASYGKSDLMSKLNSGRPMLNHVGHANENYVMMLSPQDITDANFSGLNGTTHNFTIVYTHGCYCGAFDYNDCIAEKIVTINNFAVAFIGNSRYGWFNEGQTEGPSAHLHREYMDALFNDKLNRIGRAHMESKIATAPWVTAPGQWEPGALRWCFYDCNVLGDPALAIFTDNSITISAVYPATVQTSATNISIDVSGNGSQVSDLTCVLMKDGVMIGKAVTDASGHATINFDLPVAVSGQAQLTISGINCTPVSYNLNFVSYVGLNNLPSKDASLSISPNPADAMIKVDAELILKSDYYIEIANSDGKIVLTTTQKATSNNGIAHQNIDISKLSAGYYTCVLRSGNNKLSKAFIVR